MRIIGGIRKGAVINPPKGLPVRPTMDRNKESLFNIIANYFHFEEMMVLDLFAGTGNVTFEFASRQVVSVTAVDRDRGCVKFIQQQAERFNFDNLQVVKSDVWKFVENDHNSYDFIFCDPPFTIFKADDFHRIAKRCFERGMIKQGGWFVMEHPVKTDVSQAPNYKETRNYGQCGMSFFEMPEN